MNTLISNDKYLALVAAMALNGEKYLEEHNGHIDLDDDDAPCAMLMNEIF